MARFRKWYECGLGSSGSGEEPVAVSYETFRLHKIAGAFLTSWLTHCSSRMLLPHGVNHLDEFQASSNVFSACLVVGQHSDTSATGQPFTVVFIDPTTNAQLAPKLPVSLLHTQFSQYLYTNSSLIHPNFFFFCLLRQFTADFTFHFFYWHFV